MVNKVKQVLNINVCRITNEFLPTIGGSVTHIVELSENINPYLRKQFLIVPKSDTNTDSLDSSFPFIVHRVNHPKLKLLRNLKAKWLKWLPIFPFIIFVQTFITVYQIFLLNKRHNLNLLHAHDITSGIAASISGKLLRKPVIWMLHGTLEAYSKASGRYETLALKIFRPDHIIVVYNSQRIVDKLKKMFDANRITIYRHGIDINKFNPNICSSKIKHDCELDGKFVYISVHNLDPVQGVDNAILAFDKLLKLSNSSNMVLLIIGDSNNQSYKDYLKKLTSGLNLSEKVLFLGQVENSLIPEYYSVADVALSTSSYLNVNRSTLEAMSCQKPVVLFDSGGASEILKDEKICLMAKSGNIQDLADKMLAIYDDDELRKSIGKQARDYILSNYDWDSRIDTILNIYQEVLQIKR